MENFLPEWWSTPLHFQQRENSSGDFPGKCLPNFGSRLFGTRRAGIGVPDSLPNCRGNRVAHSGRGVALSTTRLPTRAGGRSDLRTGLWEPFPYNARGATGGGLGCWFQDPIVRSHDDLAIADVVDPHQFGHVASGLRFELELLKLAKRD
ncbi:MAG TPA: hypothetical protein DDY91_01590 [Planctomycetaceae bacterium]|nr:hypothetical protein [Planctomycetaceae bacterium]